MSPPWHCHIEFKACDMELFKQYETRFNEDGAMTENVIVFIRVVGHDVIKILNFSAMQCKFNR